MNIIGCSYNIVGWSMNPFKLFYMPSLVMQMKSFRPLFAWHYGINLKMYNKIFKKIQFKFDEKHKYCK